MNMVYTVQILYDVPIPMSDGVVLSANLFLPVAQEPGETFPAVLEMIPYRKDDWRYAADHSRMSYLAQRGFVGCRLDVRGTGSSEGIALDEYTPRETQDGYETVEWLAAQPWCNGNVGMWGISYGGFTAVQVACLHPPHLKAIVPMYASDDRYRDDVHYIGGCMVVTELAQYAAGMVAMNAMPPKSDRPGRSSNWAQQWLERLEKTPPWTFIWMKQQVDGVYWRQGSLAPDYGRLQTPMLLFGGWMDSYTDPVFRMMQQCHNPRRAIVGNWVHSLPDSAYPAPNIDWLHEIVRFFDYWLKGKKNGVMADPALTLFVREYNKPEAFPAAWNGRWVSATQFPLPATQPQTLFLGAGTLEPDAPVPPTADHYPHRPTLGTHDSLCWGAGAAPNGLGRDLRPDEALSLTYTSSPLAAPLQVIGFPEVVLFLSSSAPTAHVVVRLTDVAPDGTSSLVSRGVLNLTRRNGLERCEPLVPGEVYEIKVPLKSTGYRFLPGHRLRLSVASAYWPVIWPSPFVADNWLHRGGVYPSRLMLPVVAETAESPPPPTFKTTPPELIEVATYREEPAQWQIVEDVMQNSVTVKVFSQDTTCLPGKLEVTTSEKLEMCAFHDDPAHVSLYTEEVCQLAEAGYETRIEATGTIRSHTSEFQVDLQLQVKLNGRLFFQKSWLDSIPREGL